MGGVACHRNTPFFAIPKGSPDFSPFHSQCLPPLRGVARHRRRPIPASLLVPEVLLPVVQVPLPRRAEPIGTRMDVAVVAIHTGRERERGGSAQAEQWDGVGITVALGCGQEFHCCCHSSVTEKRSNGFIVTQEIKKSLKILKV